MGCANSSTTKQILSTKKVQKYKKKTSNSKSQNSKFNPFLSSLKNGKNWLNMLDLTMADQSMISNTSNQSYSPVYGGHSLQILEDIDQESIFDEEEEKMEKLDMSSNSSIMGDEDDSTMVVLADVDQSSFMDTSDPGLSVLNPSTTKKKRFEESFSLKPKKKSKSSQDLENKGKLSKFFAKITKAIFTPWNKFFWYTIPIQKYPIVSFIQIILFSFLISSIQVEQADHIITELHLSHSFIALTFFSWFSCATDILTVIIAAKSKKFNLALSTLFYAQVINLQLSLNIGWFARCLKFGSFSLRKAEMSQSMLGVLVVLGCVALGVKGNGGKLDGYLGVFLMGLYAAFVYGEYCEYDY